MSIVTMYKKMLRGESQLIRIYFLDGLKFRKVLPQYEERIPEQRKHLERLH